MIKRPFIPKPLRKLSIYLIECNGYHKIGVAHNLGGRLNTLQTGSPHRQWLIYHKRVLNPYKIELELHQMFPTQRIRGEWFALDSKDIERLIEYVDSQRD